MRPGTNWSSGASLSYWTPWSSEFAQLPTPMIATRTLPSSARLRPLLLDIRSSMNELLANMQDALDDRDPRGRSQEVDRPLEPAPRREHEPGRDHDDALGPGAEPDVAAQAERLGLRTDVGNEERAGDRGDREDDRRVVGSAGEDERDRREHRSLADAVRRRVEERAERGGLATRAGERPVEDVEDRADDEDRRSDPVDEDRVAVLERDEDGCGDAERDAGRGERVRRDACAREARDRAARERACARRVAGLDPTEARRRRFV